MTSLKRRPQAVADGAREGQCVFERLGVGVVGEAFIIPMIDALATEKCLAGETEKCI